MPGYMSNRFYKQACNAPCHISWRTAEQILRYIIVKKEQKNEIMKAIMDKAGLESKAKSIVFSLPVSATAGMRLMDELPEDQL